MQLAGTTIVTTVLSAALLAGCATVAPGGFLFREYREETPSGTVRLLVSDAETVFDFCSGLSRRPAVACSSKAGQTYFLWVPERRYDLLVHEIAHMLLGDWHPK